MANLTDGWHAKWVKRVQLGRVYGYTNPSRLWVNAEWALEKMVDTLGHVDVKTRVGPLQHYLVQVALLRHVKI